MEFKLHQQENGTIAEYITSGKLEGVQDFVDLLGNAYYQEVNKIIIKEENLGNDFFDLKSGVAGEILQKFSNYRVKLAIVGSFKDIQSKSLRDFIRESNKMGRILFVENINEALQKMGQF